MKTMKFLFCINFILVMVASFVSCEEEKTLEINNVNDFCKIKPEGWKCSVYEYNLEWNDSLPPDYFPIATVTMTKTLDASNPDYGLVYPLFVFNVYEIERKDLLNELCDSLSMYSRHIPIYYGETGKFYLLTTPYQINFGDFSEKSKKYSVEVHRNFKNVLKDYNKSLFDDLIK